MARDTNKKGPAEQGFMGLGGFLSGLGTVLDKLGELADKGEQLHQSGEFSDAEGKVKGVYGFNVKVGLGGEGVKIEPFGNVRRDEQTGKVTVDEVREPMVDIFDEKDHVLVVAEMPGIGDEDVKLELKDDILTIVAEHGDKKFHKEVLLPASFTADQMSRRCGNGVLEVRFRK